MINSPLSNLFLDTISNIEKFEKNIEDFRDLSKKVYDFYLAKKESSRAKQVLITIKYGTAKGLRKSFIDSHKKLVKNAEKIDQSLSDAENIFNNKEKTCYTCHGLGHSYKQEYLREKGSPTRRIRKTIKCEPCKGTGKIKLDIDETEEVLIRNFIDLGNLLNNILKESLNSFDNLIKIL